MLKTLWKRSFQSAYRATNTALDAVCTTMKHFFQKIHARLSRNSGGPSEFNRAKFLPEDTAGRA
jgi:hypothetical protein